MSALYTVHIRTHTGRVRETNEDTASTVLEWRTSLHLTDDMLRERGHLFAVSDGMGGHAAGEVASSLVIKTLFDSYYTAEWEQIEEGLRQAIAVANRVVCEQAETTPAYAGMGATLAAGVLHDAELLLANVGDSRVYLFRNQQLSQVTRDHSWVAEQLATGVLDAQDIARHPYRNVVTRSLGPERDPTPDFFHLTGAANDILLLCTDGLSNLLAPTELAELLSAYPLDEAADALLEHALERGAPDNVTFILLQLLGAEDPPRQEMAMAARPGGRFDPPGVGLASTSGVIAKRFFRTRRW